MSLMKSESISKLVSALALAKAAFRPVLKLSENPGFKRNGKISKYADLATAIDATEDALLANGLVVSQFPVNDGERVGALTLLTHSSGEYLGEAFTLPLGQQNAQTGVAAVTYARRTGYLASLGIASEDDDGQTASGRDDDTVPYSGAYTHPASTTEIPDFQEARHAAPKANPAPKAQPLAVRPTPVPVPQAEAPEKVFDSLAGKEVAVADLKAAVSAPERGDAWEGPEVQALPTEAEMEGFRQKFTALANDLSTHGKLTASKGLKLNTKLLVFFLSITKADAAKNATKAQWENFFERVSAAVANPEVGLVGLTTLVNRANGIEPKQK